MKSKSVILFLILGLGMAVFWLRAQPASEMIVLKGEVVDLWCYLKNGSVGLDHKDCAVASVKAGNPIGLVTERGDIYLIMGNVDFQPGKEILLDRMAQTVTLWGRLIKRNGLQAVYVTNVSQ
jgi:hypothetical protein